MNCLDTAVFPKVVAVTLCGVVVTCVAHCAILTVGNTADSGAGSLRQTIGDANEGDQIVFATNLARQTIFLTSGELLVSKSLQIAGLGAEKIAIARSPLESVPSFWVFNFTSGTSLVSGLTISNGVGGIHNSTDLTLENCDISQNRGVGLNGGGPMTVQGCTLSRNRGVGLNLIGYGSRAALINCTIAENAGGGVAHKSDTGHLSLLNCTVVGNSGSTLVQTVTAAILWQYGSMDLKNTIVAGNTSSVDLGVGSLTEGESFSSGHNLLGSIMTQRTVGWTDTDLFSVSAENLKLGALAVSRGTTPTMVPQSGSPVIDAGDPAGAPLTDQRGIKRPTGLGVDIGACEFTLAEARAASNQRVRLTFSGVSGAQYRLQESGDLVAWRSTTNRLSAVQGFVTFEVEMGDAQRFFRTAEE